MLIGCNVGCAEDLALLDVWKTCKIKLLVLIVLCIITYVVVNGKIALGLDYVTACLEDLTVIFNLNRNSIKNRRLHLAGNKALPDKFIKSVLLAREHFSDRFRSDVHV